MVEKKKAEITQVVEEKVQEQVVKSAEMPPLPRQPKTDPVEVKVDDFKVGVLTTIYVLYKGNLLTRNNLRELIQVLNQPAPDGGVAKYLVDEAAKA